MVVSYENILSHFPHDEIRGKQEQVAGLIETFLNDPEKKYLLLQAPVGMGKSALNIMAAKAAGSAYVATANKALQDQYIRSYGHMMSDLKGRANYSCRESPGKNCGNAPCRDSKKSRAVCHKNRMCEYHDAFDDAAGASIASFNFASFLAFTQYFPNEFGPRSLLVCDEAHNVPEWLTGHVGVSVSQRGLDRLGLPFNVPRDNDPEALFDFFMDLKEEVAGVLDDPESGLTGAAEEQLEALYHKLDGLAVFVGDDRSAIDNFVVVRDPERGVELKPINVAVHAKKMILSKADKCIFTSATFLDFKTFYSQMGMPEDEVQVIRVGSSFPKENRPIYLSKVVGALDYKAVMLGPRGEPVGELLPDLVQAIREILALYPRDKGIIHCKPYGLCRYIVGELKDPRIIFPASAGEQKEALERHERSPEPTVLISPSLTEGIDLKDHLSRFQILAKVPYPNTQDPLIARRRHVYPGYYLMKTAIEIV